MLARRDQKKPIWGMTAMNAWFDLRYATENWESKVDPIIELLAAARAIWIRHLDHGNFLDSDWENLRAAIARVETEARIFLKKGD